MRTWLMLIAMGCASVPALKDDGGRDSGVLAPAEESSSLDTGGSPEGTSPTDTGEIPPATDEDDAPSADTGAPDSDGGRLATGDPVPAEMASIVDDIPGFASGTIGGRDGTIYVVNTLDDAGPGSLRMALESDSPLWIVFADGLNGTILIESRIFVRSFKTVDARGHDITLQAVRDRTVTDLSLGWDNTSLSIGWPGDRSSEVRDIVFLNLTFDGSWPHPDDDGEGADGLHLRNHAHNIWVHQCTFRDWIDGAIDARKDEVSGYDTQPYNITISSSHFYDIHQGFLLEANNVTFARNHCDNLNTRCVKSVDGTAHMINNVVRNWRRAEVVFAKGDAQILVDHNIFEYGSDSDEPGQAEDGGRLQDVHNVRYPGLDFNLRDNGSVDADFKAAAQAAYGLDRKVDCEHDPVDTGCWNALYTTILEEAGVQLFE